VKVASAASVMATVDAWASGSAGRRSAAIGMTFTARLVPQGRPKSSSPKVHIVCLASPHSGTGLLIEKNE
jgi:hypothetical protein